MLTTKQTFVNNYTVLKYISVASINISLTWFAYTTFHIHILKVVQLIWLSSSNMMGVCTKEIPGSWLLVEVLFA